MSALSARASRLSTSKNRENIFWSQRETTSLPRAIWPFEDIEFYCQTLFGRLARGRFAIHLTMCLRTLRGGGRARRARRALVRASFAMPGNFRLCWRETLSCLTLRPIFTRGAAGSGPDNVWQTLRGAAQPGKSLSHVAAPRRHASRGGRPRGLPLCGSRA